MGEFWIAENFGDICPCDKKCGSGCGEFAYGGLAHQYGWPHAPITKWKAGSIEGVAWWQTLGRHGGGLMKVPFPQGPRGQLFHSATKPLPLILVRMVMLLIKLKFQNPWNPVMMY